MNKRTGRIAQALCVVAPAGLAWLRSRGQSRRKMTGAFMLAASGIAAFAGVRMLRRPRLASVEQGRFSRESEIDNRIAESFPASDPVWQP